MNEIDKMLTDLREVFPDFVHIETIRMLHKGETEIKKEYWLYISDKDFGKRFDTYEELNKFVYFTIYGQKLLSNEFKENQRYTEGQLN